MKIAVTTLAFCVAALLALGMVMLYSAGLTEARTPTQVQAGPHYLLLQMTWCVLGLVLCATATMLDYRLLKKIVWPLFGVAMVLLVLVLLPLPHGFTKKINGTHRWFILPGMRLQPSEFAKLALLIVLAWYGEHFQRQMGGWKRGILIPGLCIGLVCGLIFKEPDVGNALLIGAVSGIVLLLAGIRMKYFLPPLIAALLAVGIFIYHDPMRSGRIYSWLHLEETKLAKGHQAYQAMVALGSGGITGKGLGNGRQKLGWVPEHHTDFIFSIIGEELGLVATLVVVVAFVVIVLCGVYISLRAPDPFGVLLGCGLTLLIGLQAFINIGVVTSALPNKGLPLPFISYGGSNLLAMFACVGLLFSIARRGRETQRVTNPFAADELPQPA